MCWLPSSHESPLYNIYIYIICIFSPFPLSPPLYSTPFFHSKKKRMSNCAKSPLNIQKIKLIFFPSTSHDDDNDDKHDHNDDYDDDYSPFLHLVMGLIEINCEVTN